MTKLDDAQLRRLEGSIHDLVKAIRSLVVEIKRLRESVKAR